MTGPASSLSITVAPTMKQAVAPRHDVERVARVQEPHRPLEVDLARAHTQPLAAHAAQAGKLAARGEAPAVDDDIGVVRILPAKRCRATTSTPARAASSRRKRIASRGRHVRFARHRRGRRRSGPRGRAPARVQLRRIELVEAFGHAREALELGAVARAGDHQRALRRRCPDRSRATAPSDSSPRSRTTGSAASVSQ